MRKQSKQEKKKKKKTFIITQQSTAICFQRKQYHLSIVEQSTV